MPDDANAGAVEARALVERLTKSAEITACEDPFLAGAEDAGKTLYGEAAFAIRSLLALRERVEGERDEARALLAETPDDRALIYATLSARAQAAESSIVQAGLAVEAAESSLTRRPDATDLFEAFEASLVEGTPSLALQCGRIWIDAETAFDARAFIDGLFAHAEAAEALSSQLEAELQEAIELIRRCERRLDAVEGLNRSALRMHLQTFLSKSLPRAALQPQEGRS